LECSFDPLIEFEKLLKFNCYKEELLKKDFPISEDGIVKWIKERADFMLSDSSF